MCGQSTKDLDQVEQVFQVLLDHRPGDVLLAYDAAAKLGEQFLRRFRAGLDQLTKAIKDAFFAHVSVD